MSDHLNKKDLARNELGEIVAHGIEYAEHHVRQLALIFGGLLLAGIVAVLGWLWAGRRAEAANELLAKALKVHSAPIVASGALPEDAKNPSFGSETARRERAKQLFKELDGLSLAPRVTRVADLYLGEIALAEGDKAAARQHWTRFIERADGTALAAAAELNLVRLDRDGDKAAELVTRLQGMLENPSTRRLPEDMVLYQLGLTLDKLGKTDEARATFRRLVDEFPRSPFQAEARRFAGPAGV